MNFLVFKKNINILLNMINLITSYKVLFMKGFI